LVLFFKKEQKRKKQKTFFNLASVYGLIGSLVRGVRWMGLTFVYLGVLRVFVVNLWAVRPGNWSDG
jgi:hypothetical protein